MAGVCLGCTVIPSSNNWKQRHAVFYLQLFKEAERGVTTAVIKTKTRIESKKQKQKQKTKKIITVGIKKSE